jgi:hypothetical protein
MPKAQFGQRLTHFVQFVVDTYPDVQIEVVWQSDNDYFIRAIQGVDNVFVQSQAYRMNINDCPPPTLPIVMTFGSQSPTFSSSPALTQDFYRKISLTDFFGSRTITPKLKMEFESFGDMEALLYYKIGIGGTWNLVEDWTTSISGSEEVDLPTFTVANDISGIYVRLRLQPGQTEPLGGVLKATLLDTSARFPEDVDLIVQTPNTFNIATELTFITLRVDSNSLAACDLTPSGYYINTPTLDEGTRIYDSNYNLLTGDPLYAIDSIGQIWLVTDGVVIQSTEAYCTVAESNVRTIYLPTDGSTAFDMIGEGPPTSPPINLSSYERIWFMETDVQPGFTYNVYDESDFASLFNGGGLDWGIIMGEDGKVTHVVTISSSGVLNNWRTEP